MAYAREEAQQVMFGALDALFRNIGIKPRDISIFVVNCSLFNPTPSLSAIAEKERKKVYAALLQSHHRRRRSIVTSHLVGSLAHVLASCNRHRPGSSRESPRSIQNEISPVLPSFPLLRLLHRDPKSVSLPELSPSCRRVTMTVQKGALSRQQASRVDVCSRVTRFSSCSFSLHRRSPLSLSPSQPCRKPDLRPTPTTATIALLHL